MECRIGIPNIHGSGGVDRPVDRKVLYGARGYFLSLKNVHNAHYHGFVTTNGCGFRGHAGGAEESNGGYGGMGGVREYAAAR